MQSKKPKKVVFNVDSKLHKNLSESSPDGNGRDRMNSESDGLIVSQIYH